MKYYYTKLDDNGKNIYKKIYYAIKNFEKKVELIADKELVNDIYFKVIYDNPLFFYINPYKLSICKTSRATVVLPYYIYNKSESEIIKSQIEQIVNPFLKKLKNVKSLIQKERYIHKYLINDIKYKYQSKSDDVDCHSIVGVFIHKKAVCDGISKAFKYLCDLNKIPTNIVIGSSSLEHHSEQSHAWNMIRLDGKWYHTDVTWDLTLMGELNYIRYDYFNLSEDNINLDHTDYQSYETCDSYEHNFFNINNSYISSKKELEVFLDNKVREMKEENIQKNIYFKIDLKIKDVDKVVQNKLSEAFRKHFLFCGGYTFYPNKIQGVYLIITNI